jgi:octaprenyl-diphosphate synthase
MTHAAFLTQLPTDVADHLASILDMVEDVLKSQCQSQVKTIESVGDVTRSAGGKRLRPTLAVLSALATGLPVDHGRLASLAASLEMVHMATLIHDDVIDAAETRRGKPTASHINGNTAAILGGDVLLAKAMRLLALDGDLRVIRAVSDAVVELAEGEVRELEVRNNFELTEETYLEVVAMKTSTLISCCCRVGAMATQAPRTIEEPLAQFGFNLGTAFQIIDDVLDYSAQDTVTGKPRGTDFKEGQATLPLIDLRSRINEQELAGTRMMFGNPLADVGPVYKTMVLHGSLERASKAAHEQAQRARMCLDDIPPTPFADLLAQISDFVVSRDA